MVVTGCSSSGGNPARSSVAVHADTAVGRWYSTVELTIRSLDSDVSAVTAARGNANDTADACFSLKSNVADLAAAAPAPTSELRANVRRALTDYQVALRQCATKTAPSGRYMADAQNALDLVTAVAARTSSTESP
jgi:hypothetical protein